MKASICLKVVLLFGSIVLNSCAYLFPYQVGEKIYEINNRGQDYGFPIVSFDKHLEYQRKLMKAGKFPSLPNREVGYHVILDNKVIESGNPIRIKFSNESDIKRAPSSVVIGFPEGLDENGSFLFDARLVCEENFKDKNDCVSIRGMKPFKVRDPYLEFLSL